jgi:uncharacterized protein YlzI (FlbEa/FlbD family)
VLAECQQVISAPTEKGKTMNNFIEVTDLDGRKRLINTAWIEEIWEGDNATIYFAFQADNMVDQDYLVVKESYAEIKKMIWR